jgi:hypothetical protein
MTDIVERKPDDFTAHKQHRVERTTPDEPTIWLAVQYGENPPISPRLLGEIAFSPSKDLQNSWRNPFENGDLSLYLLMSVGVGGSRGQLLPHFSLRPELRP